MLRQWLSKADDIVTYVLHYVYRSALYVKAVLTTLLQSYLPRCLEHFLCAAFDQNMLYFADGDHVCTHALCMGELALHIWHHPSCLHALSSVTTHRV